MLYGAWMHRILSGVYHMIRRTHFFLVGSSQVVNSFPSLKVSEVRIERLNNFYRSPGLASGGGRLGQEGKGRVVYP